MKGHWNREEPGKFLLVFQSLRSTLFKAGESLNGFTSVAGLVWIDLGAEASSMFPNLEEMEDPVNQERTSPAPSTDVAAKAPEPSCEGEI